MSVSFTDVVHAQQKIGSLIRKTPLQFVPTLSRMCECRLHLKLENLQHTGSFKARGALNRLLARSAEERAREIVTASSGNHGLAVLYAASLLENAEPIVFLPTTIPQSKIDRLSEFGGQLRFQGRSYDEANVSAQELARERGALFVHAYADHLVIAGQATVALELMLELPDVEAIIVPVSGGGLLSGVAIVAKTINPKVAIVGAQPEASPAAYLSFRDGRPYERYEAQPTIADGLAGGFGRMSFEITRGLIDEIVLVSEEDIRAGIYAILESTLLLVEGSGAVGVAALVARKLSLKNKKVAAIISGGNIDLDLFLQIAKEKGNPSAAINRVAEA